jgi:hypothetical protein
MAQIVRSLALENNRSPDYCFVSDRLQDADESRHPVRPATRGKLRQLGPSWGRSGRTYESRICRLRQVAVAHASKHIGGTRSMRPSRSHSALFVAASWWGACAGHARCRSERAGRVGLGVHRAGWRVESAVMRNPVLSAIVRSRSATNSRRSVTCCTTCSIWACCGSRWRPPGAAGCGGPERRPADRPEGGHSGTTGCAR